MNESNQLISNKPKTNLSIKKHNLRIKVDKDYFKSETTSKYRDLVILISLIFLLLCLFILKLIKGDNILKLSNWPNNNTMNLEIKTENKPQEQINKQLDVVKENKNKESDKSDKSDNIQDDDLLCNELDPINIFSGRLKENPLTICKSGISKHLCYKNSNHIFVAKNGVICKMENIILDPSKWTDGGFIYKGPVDPSNRGCPILQKGFLNMKCDRNVTEIQEYAKMYKIYFESWNYEYNNNEDEEELAPGKTIFFLSRNQDSPNLYHGGSEFVNAISLMYLLDIKPEDIQVVFLESIALNDDPFYDLYKNLISRGGEPIYIKNLKKKYHISSAVHIPINWDSPCFIFSRVPNCKNPTTTYKFYNDLIDKYMNIPNYEDSFKSDNETFYYPKSVIDNYNSNTSFTKIVTFQWRRVWPKGREGQQRILGNGPELAEKLSSLLPKNILLRLIDTASLPIAEQISIIRKTDYFIGMHGSGLCLSIYAPSHCIIHEVLPKYNMNGLLLMASLSGHKTYSNILPSEIKEVENNEMVYFEPEKFVNTVIEHMKESHLID